MKFGHEFQAALQDFPEEWQGSIIDYKQLKKAIKKLATELRSWGLDSDTLAQLLPDPDSKDAGPESRRGSASFKYEFNGDQTTFTPKLTIFVRNGILLDASLSSDTRSHLKNLALQQSRPGSKSLEELDPPAQQHDHIPETPNDSGNETPLVEQIEVPLEFGSKFFRNLQQEVKSLEDLQEKEQKLLTDQIAGLSKAVTALSKPSKFRKTDMNRWREVFEIYLQASVFFSTNELDHGYRTAEEAAAKLQWFQSEVMRRNLTHLFKLKTSHQALEQFVEINKKLLLNIKFQEFNQTAIYKIMKKFDKRTQLGASKALPSTLPHGSEMPKAMAKAVSFQISQDLVSVIPQLDDYTCTICSWVKWRPVLLRCGHLLCISCACNLMAEDGVCPFCRKAVIMELHAGHIDKKLENYLEKHFPKEVFEKRVKVETEAGREQFGDTYIHPSKRNWFQNMLDLKPAGYIAESQ